MKLELIKYTKLNGEVWYRVTADGRYVEHTCTMNQEEAEKRFEDIVNGKKEIDETIKSVNL